MNQYIKLAIQQAEQSEMQARVGAVLVKNRKVLGSGFNRPSHPQIKRKIFNYPHRAYSLHAEKAATYKCLPSDVDGARLYVIRVKRSGSLALSLPCKICRKHIRKAGIKRVYFSTNGGDILRYDPRKQKE